MNTSRTNQEFCGEIIYATGRKKEIKVECVSIFDMIVHLKDAIDTTKPVLKSVCSDVHAFIYSPDRRFLWSYEQFKHGEWNAEVLYKIAWLFNRAFGLRGTIAENDDGTYDYCFKMKRRLSHIVFNISDGSVISIDDYITDKVSSWMTKMV